MRLYRAQGVSPDSFQSQRDQAKIWWLWFGFNGPAPGWAGGKGGYEGCSHTSLCCSAPWRPAPLWLHTELVVSQMCSQESCGMASNSARVGETSPVKKESKSAKGWFTPSQTVYRLGDTWELLQQPSGDHSHISAFVLWFPPAGGQIHVHPSFSPEQNGKLCERRKSCQVGEVPRRLQNKDTFSDSH